MRWARIFRSGRHTSRQGLERNYPISELHQVVESYNPAVYKAPLIIDHDTRGVPDSEVAHKSFCYGYPELLKVVGTTLKAGFEHIAPEFLEWVDRRNLVAVSPGFYLPEDPRNPTPGLLHARHIAALGDKPPSVKNNGDLSDLLVEFSEEDPGLFLPGFELEFEEQEAVNLDSLLMSAFQPVIDRLGGLATELNHEEQPMTKTAESAAAIIKIPISGDRLATILTKGGSTAKEQQEVFTHLGVEFCEYSEPEPTAQEKALAKREADLVEREAKIRQQAIADFTEPLVREGRLLAADKAGIVAVLGAVEAIQDVEYSEGDKSVSKAPGELLKNFLKRLPIQIEFSELAQAADDQGDDAPEFEEAPGYSVDSGRLRLHQKALAHQKKHGGDYSAAVKAVGGR
jgi:hypothetical protein